jgi:hypothetical protein
MSVLFALAAPAAEQVCSTPAECANLGVNNFIGTPARVWASVAVLVALFGVVVGGLALSRSRRGTGNGGRTAAIVALVAGLIGIINGAANLAVADGGLGTGNGVAGGAFALILGLVGAVPGWRTLTRSRRTEPTG